MAASEYTNPHVPKPIKTTGMSVPMEATVVAAHKEQVTNDLSPMQNSKKKRDFGKEGIRGDGMQK